MKRTDAVWFDFTDFSAKVAELNRLHAQVGELSDLRWRTRDSKDIARWEDAVERWRAFSGFGDSGFYVFESDRFLAALAAGDAGARACAVTFLEFDPYYHRSGYMKSKLLVRLKHLALSPKEIARLRNVVCRAVLSPHPKCEFRDYARLLKNIGSPEFRREIQDLPVPDLPHLQARRARCLEAVYWR